MVSQPPRIHVVNYMWLFRHKLKSNDALERHKAHLVCDGKSQEVGIDCDDTFSFVVKPATIQTVLSLALTRNINQLNIKNAFLHDAPKETVYMHQPPVLTSATLIMFVFSKRLYIV